MEFDKILVENLAVCEKRDIIYPSEIVGLDPMTSSIILEILSVFELCDICREK